MKKQSNFPSSLGSILGVAAGVLPGLGDYYKYKADEKRLDYFEKQRRKRKVILKSILGGLAGGALGSLLYQTTGVGIDYLKSKQK